MGLGRGWLAGIEAGRDAIDLVISLVLDDPRIDRQVEMRDGYYATLLLALDADRPSLIARLEAPVAREPDGWLRRGTLGELARRGVPEARAALERIAASDEREAWRLEMLEPQEPRPPRPDQGPRARRPVAELVPLALLLEQEAIRTVPRTREESLAYLAALRALDHVPSESALPWARGALDRPWPVSLGARRVLERHATEDDRAEIEGRASLALSANEHHALCSFVDALGTIGSAASVPLLVEIYDTATYSYARWRVLCALAPHAEDPRVAARLRESLWDADFGARLEATEVADLSDPVVHARVKAMADDPAEDVEVREAARERLA
jgi:hypothetical protein